MAQHGTSKAYILGRLRREGRTDFIDAIEAGRISALTAAIELGWVKRPPTVGFSTNQARRRQHQLRTITGAGLTPDQMMELWLGPGPSGSLFNSREELQEAWEKHRDEILRRWGSGGRRPAAYYEFEWDGPRPSYDVERSTLWRAGALSEVERAVLEDEWRAEFDAAWAPGFTLNAGGGELLTGSRARAAHLRWADVPHGLVVAWTAERKHRGQRPASPEEVAAGAAHAGAAPET
jgi:hypothetical protein